MDSDRVRVVGRWVLGPTVGKIRIGIPNIRIRLRTRSKMKLLEEGHDELLTDVMNSR